MKEHKDKKKKTHHVSKDKKKKTHHVSKDKKKKTHPDEHEKIGDLIQIRDSYR